MRSIYILILVALVGCGSPAGNNEASSEVHDLDAAAFNEKVKEGVVLIDVRTPEEFADGSIGGALNMNFNDGSFEKSLESLDKTKEYALYCGAGGRSAKAAALMKSKGFTQVNNLAGGIQSWKASGLPVTPQ